MLDEYFEFCKYGSRRLHEDMSSTSPSLLLGNHEITNGSMLVNYVLRRVVTTGLADYAGEVTWGPPTKLGFKASQLPFVWRAVRSIFEVPAVGEAFGNSLVAESLPLYYLLAPLEPGLPTFMEEVETLQMLLDHMGQDKPKRCVAGLHNISVAPQGPSEEALADVCRLCKEVLGCRQAEDGTYRILRLTLRQCSALQSVPAQPVAPLQSVRILDVGDANCLQPRKLATLIAIWSSPRIGAPLSSWLDDPRLAGGRVLSTGAGMDLRASRAAPLEHRAVAGELNESPPRVPGQADRAGKSQCRWKQPHRQSFPSALPQQSHGAARL
ncbi:ANKRD17 [Symbiodinium natans]|uniref:ANKRD17 protein n=1 Tax=Symbiodinium natans TaxID=878477 RepID=A0A812QWC9_9DINO|nr:ANKRD17 [Symbiodinium natans]